MANIILLGAMVLFFCYGAGLAVTNGKDLPVLETTGIGILAFTALTAVGIMIDLFLKEPLIWIN